MMKIAKILDVIATIIYSTAWFVIFTGILVFIANWMGVLNNG